MKLSPTLGKIVGLLMIALPVMAGVKASVDRTVVYRGDSVMFSIKADGENVVFPQIDSIGGYPIEGVSSQRHLSIVNGKTQRAIEKKLRFTPLKDVVIPSFDLSVDGKMEHTVPISIKVVKSQAAIAGAPMQLQMRLESNTSYVGEPVQLDLIFRTRPSERIERLNFEEPKLTDFWIKPLDKEAVQGRENGYNTYTYRYLLFAQKSGELKIPATFAQVAKRVRQRGRSGNMFNDPFFENSFFGSRLQTKKVYSNESRLIVKPLPDNLEVYGDFKMRAYLDKTKVKANKPVNLTIRIEGEGNVEDIKKFALDLPNAVVYANDPTIQGSLRNGSYYGVFEQKIAVIPDRNVTIPSMAFRYFDKTTKTIRTKRTPSFTIDVEGGVKPVPVMSTPQASRLESAPASTPATTAVEREPNPYEMAGMFTAGALSGAFCLWLIQLWGRERSENKVTEQPIIKRIKGAKSDRELFELLIAHQHEHRIVDEALAILERRLYGKSTETVNLKALRDYFGGKITEPVELI